MTDKADQAVATHTWRMGRWHSNGGPSPKMIPKDVLSMVQTYARGYGCAVPWYIISDITMSEFADGSSEITFVGGSFDGRKLQWQMSIASTEERQRVPKFPCILVSRL